MSGGRRAFVLPDDDAALAALDAASRALVARLWRRRAHNERQTSAVFASLAGALAADAADAAVVALARAAVDEELSHGALCLEVAERYEPSPPLAQGVDETAAAPLAPVSAPSFRGADATAGALPWVVLQCCLNETIASAYLRVCLEQAAGPTARGAVRELLRDEVSHSRLGWAHLASERVDARGRALVARALPVLLEAVQRVWLADPDGLDDAVPRGHGSLPLAEVREVVHEAVGALVVPGLEHVGVDAARAVAWLTGARAGRRRAPAR